MIINIFKCIEEFKKERRRKRLEILIPLIRRVVPSQIANSILGVQPMTGPTGQAFSLKINYDDD